MTREGAGLSRRAFLRPAAAVSRRQGAAALAELVDGRADDLDVIGAAQAGTRRAGSVGTQTSPGRLPGLRLRGETERDPHFMRTQRETGPHHSVVRWKLPANGASDHNDGHDTRRGRGQ